MRAPRRRADPPVRPSMQHEHLPIYAHRAYYHIGRHTIIKGTGQSLTALVTSSSALRDPRVRSVVLLLLEISLEPREMGDYRDEGLVWSFA